MDINLSFGYHCGKVSFSYEGFLNFLSRESKKNGMCPTTEECVPFKITSSIVYCCYFPNVVRDTKLEIYSKNIPVGNIIFIV